tara:strand:- start:1369 stop:1524 length:156 start_codon:yes stop_codon:yes gene_type:complete
MEILYYSMALIFITGVCLLIMFQITEKDRQYIHGRRNAMTRKEEEFKLKTK